MLQPVTRRITCSTCNVSYELETRLRDHQKMSHRGGITEETPQATADVVQSEDRQV
jgi:hypothetical protein